MHPKEAAKAQLLSPWLLLTLHITIGRIAIEGSDCDFLSINTPALPELHKSRLREREWMPNRDINTSRPPRSSRRDFSFRFCAALLISPLTGADVCYKKPSLLAISQGSVVLLTEKLKK